MEAKQSIGITNVLWRINASKKERVANVKFELLADMPITSEQIHQLISEFQECVKNINRGAKNE